MDLSRVVVSFDMNGILIDSEEYMARATVSICRDFCGIEISEDEALTRYGGFLSAHKFTQIVAEKNPALLRQDDWPGTLEAMRQRHGAAKRMLYELPDIPVIPDGIAAAATLNAQAYTLVINSNNRSYMSKVALQKLGLQSCFSSVYGSDSVGDRPKPGPDMIIHTHTVHRPALLIHIDNTLPGVQAAAAARQREPRTRIIAFIDPRLAEETAGESRRAMIAAGADVVVRSMAAVPDAVAAITQAFFPPPAAAPSPAPAPARAPRLRFF